MFEVKVKDGHLEFDLPYTYPVDKYKQTFTTNAASEFIALLEADNLNTEFHNQIKKIREQAYNQGWKDAKAKRKRIKNFSSGGQYYRNTHYIGY